jgi:hypothetical protein
MPALPNWLRRHGLGLTLAGVLLAFTTATLVLGWREYTTEQQTHGQAVDTAGFLLWWWFEYTMSLVADVFGVLLIVMLTKRLHEIGSAESK